MSAKYQIEIWQNNNSTLERVCEVINPLPLNKGGTILEFTKELSDFGQAHFRISSYDNILKQYGDVFVPHQYHIRVIRNGVVVWKGAIINNDKRTSSYWDIECAEYEWYLNKLPISRSSTDPSNGKADGIYRIFNSGNMATAVTDLINETISLLNQSTNKSSTLSGMTVGDIENPNFPPNITDSTGKALAGAWEFSTTLQLQFDFQTLLYVLKSMGNLSYADFELDENLVFNFKKFIGNDRHYDVNFVFNKSGEVSQSNIIDYNLPRLGERQVNDLWGIATDTNGTILHSEQRSESSVTNDGLLWGVAAYADVNDQGILAARTAAELQLIDSSSPTNVTVVLNQHAAYPLGVWDIGDIVTIKIKDNGVDFSDFRRVVGVSVNVNSTGLETTTAQTNVVLPFQYASINS